MMDKGLLIIIGFLLINSMSILIVFYSLTYENYICFSAGLSLGMVSVFILTSLINGIQKKKI